jgi:hypothetical protein
LIHANEKNVWFSRGAHVALLGLGLGRRGKKREEEGRRGKKREEEGRRGCLGLGV